MSGAKTLADLGGPVFPQETHNADGSTSVWFGMNLRDLFAAAALQGLIAVPYGERPSTWKMAAGSAYEAADAMLAAREKQ